MMNKAKTFLMCMVFLLVPVMGLAEETGESLQVQHMELLKKAKALYDKGDPAQTVAVCDEYIEKLGPDFHPQVWFLRGNAFHKIFTKTHKESDIGNAIDSYENALALYGDVKTFTGLDSLRYQIDGLFNLGLLYEEQYKLLARVWDDKTREEKEWKILSNISQAMSMSEMCNEWKDSINDQQERYLDRSLETFLNMILLTRMPDVYRPLCETVCTRGSKSKQRAKYATYATDLNFDPSIKACVHWIRGKELAERVHAYDKSINHLRLASRLAQSERARASISRQIGDIYLKKDSFEDKMLALDYATEAWKIWKKNRAQWGDDPAIFDTYGASLKAVAVGVAMKKEPDYDRVIQLCHQSDQIPQWKDRYYMHYLLSFSAYHKGDEDQFYRFGKQAVQKILGKYRNEFDNIQSEEEREVLLFWVNSLRGSGRILEAMRYKQMGDQLSKNTL